MHAPRILTAIDGRPGSATVLQRAARLAAELHASLAVVHVVRAAPALVPELHDPQLPADVAAALFPEVVEALAGTGVSWTFHVAAGDLARELGRLAREVDAGVIVVGAHEGGLRLPRSRCSVQQLLRDLEVPLLVLPRESAAVDRLRSV